MTPKEFLEMLRKYESKRHFMGLDFKYMYKNLLEVNGYSSYDLQAEIPKELLVLLAEKCIEYHENTKEKFSCFGGCFDF
jgi:hypothetical protein